MRRSRSPKRRPTALGLLRRSLQGLLLGSLCFVAALETRAAFDPIPRVIEFWVIEPNEGQASGGHAALRIDDRVFHVEHRGDGLMADRRTPRLRFEEIYRLRENRGIEALPLHLEPEAGRLLSRRLEQRYADRKRNLDRLDGFETEARWLEQGRREGSVSVEIPGGGLFQNGPCSASEKARNESLLRRIARRYGTGWLDRQRSEAKTKSRSLVDQLLAPRRSLEPLSPPFPAEVGPGGLHRRLLEAVQLETALRSIYECRPLAARPLIADGLGDEPSPARPGAIESWSRTRAELANRLLELVSSDRPDRGLALFLTRARLFALDHSIETKSLWVLDPRREETRTDLSLRENLPREWFEAEEIESRRRFHDAMEAFENQEGPLEVRFANLERAQHAEQHLRNDTFHAPHLQGGKGENKSGDLFRSASLQYASATRRLSWPERHAHSAVARIAAATRARADRERLRLQGPLGYRLVTQNCVTELLSMLEIGGEEASPGHIIRSGRFVPSLAAGALEKALPTGPRYRLPSARELRIAESEGQNPWRRLGEQITLTSRHYQPHPADSSFLFFTDQNRWSRPLLGTANLGYGLATAGLGLFSAPFDRGQTLRRGLQGALMSVPEMLFFRIRQGTYLETHPAQRARLGLSLEP